MTAVRWAALAMLAAIVTIAAAFAGAVHILAELALIPYRSGYVTAALLAGAASSTALSYTAARACQAAIRSRNASAVQRRVHYADAKDWALLTLGYGGAGWLVLLFGLFIAANQFAVGETFFDLGLIWQTAPLIIAAFRYNIEIFVIAEILILIWGMVIALARLAPGPAGAPIRFLATVYSDLFRALPTIVAVYLIAFGLPLTGLSLFSNASPVVLAVIALTLSYGAYEAEIYRAGVNGVHWSQTAGARSLGLSYLQTLRYVVVPQALKRIVPPLLNDFVSLQKDTALVSVVGTVEAFNQAKIIASNHFNLSAVTTVAILFIAITIPQARLVDRLLERDRQRTQAGG